MQLYLIRHAQSTNNALADERERVSDPLLSELGYRQAEILARHLAAGPSREPYYPPLAAPGESDRRNGHGFGLTRLFCSAQRRALLTARPIAAATELTPEVWLDLHEEGGVWLDHGEPVGVAGYGGIARSELAAEFPSYRLPDALTEAGWWSGTRETPEESAVRAGQVAQALRTWPNPDDRLGVITHGAFAVFLLRALLGHATERPVFYHLDNTGISLLRFYHDGGVTLRYLNRVEHLTPDIIT